MSNRVKNFLLTDNMEDILFYAEYNSKFMFDYVKEKSDHELYMCRKYLTHSDIVTKGKPTKKKKQSCSREEFAKSFILYYQSSTILLENYESLPTAAQSNIGIPEEFMSVLNFSSYKDNHRAQYDICNKYNTKILIPKDSVRDFNLKNFLRISNFNNKNKYNQAMLRKLGSFNINLYIDTEDNRFIKCDALHVAAHGFGTDKDKVISNLRAFAFKGDVVNFLFDKTNNCLFVFFERNEEYYNLLNEINNTPISKQIKRPIWKDYRQKDKQNIVETLYALDVDNSLNNNEIDDLTMTSISETKIAKLLKNYYDEYNKSIEDILALHQAPKTRWYQKRWKEVLIKMDELALNEKGYAICAISGIKGAYAKLGRFFIASHIKPYAQCINEKDYESAFDPNNGLIRSANVDALFDQYLISVNADDGSIMINDVVATISRYKQLFNSKNTIPSYYMTEKRKEYLKLHNYCFNQKVNIDE